MKFPFYDQCKIGLIPDISDELVEQMLLQMKPVIRRDQHRFWEIRIDGVDRRTTAYTWEPKLIRPVKIYLGGLESKVIPTFHTYGYHGFFNPSLAEVCAAINRCVPDWSMVRYFWLNPETVQLVEPYQWCRCAIFSGECHEVIDAEWEPYLATHNEMSAVGAQESS